MRMIFKKKRREFIKKTFLIFNLFLLAKSKFLKIFFKKKYKKTIWILKDTDI